MYRLTCAGTYTKLWEGFQPMEIYPMLSSAQQRLCSSFQLTHPVRNVLLWLQTAANRCSNLERWTAGRGGGVEVDYCTIGGIRHEQLYQWFTFHFSWRSRVFQLLHQHVWIFQKFAYRLCRVEWIEWISVGSVNVQKLCLPPVLQRQVDSQCLILDKK